MNIFKKKTEKHTEKLPMTGKVKKGFRIYCTAIMGAALVLGTSVTAFAANDPITVINNLSTFIFGLIRAIGLMCRRIAMCRSRPTILSSMDTICPTVQCLPTLKSSRTKTFGASIG